MILFHSLKRISIDWLPEESCICLPASHPGLALARHRFFLKFWKHRYVSHQGYSSLLEIPASLRSAWLSGHYSYVYIFKRASLASLKLEFTAYILQIT